MLRYILMKGRHTHAGAARWLTWLLAGVVTVGVTLPHGHVRGASQHDHAGCTDETPPPEPSQDADTECALCLFLHAAHSMVATDAPVAHHQLSSCGGVAPQVSDPGGRLVHLSVSARAPPCAAV